MVRIAANRSASHLGLALFTKHTRGRFAHALLVLALVLGLIHLVRGSNP